MERKGRGIMTERTCEQVTLDPVTLDAPGPLTFSEDGGEPDGRSEPERMAERPARLLEVGDYPDKSLTLTAADLDALAVQFSEEGAAGVPVKVEHVDSPLDPLGSVRAVWREGNALLATLAFPTDLAAFLRRRGAAKLSVALTRDPLRLREVSLVLKPRVLSATLMSGEEVPSRLADSPPSPHVERVGIGAGEGEGVEVVRLRAELASRDVEAHLAAFKAQGRIVPASEGPARVLLAAVGEAVVTLSDGPEPIGRIFRRFLRRSRRPCCCPRSAPPVRPKAKVSGLRKNMRSYRSGWAWTPP